MADLGAENFSLSKLLTSSFQANPAWKDLADATTEVLTKNVESHRRKLARIRDTIQNRQGDIVNDVYYSGGRVEDSAGDTVALPLNTRIPSAKILRIEQNNSTRLELGVDYALIEFTLADGKSAYWRMPMNAPQERSILIDNAKMLGFDFFNTALSDEDYQRLNEYVSLYWPEGGTENFIRFISFLKNISLEMAPLWSKDDGLDEFPILDARDPNDNERVPAYLGGEWYQTSHVELRYDPIRDVDPTETFEIQMAFYREIENLFYLFAPIILVLERIVATITLHWFVYVGTAGHLTEIWQEKLVIIPLESLCSVYINTSERINNDCLINRHEGPLIDCPKWANSLLPANLVCPANPGDPICTPTLSPLFNPQFFPIASEAFDGLGAVHLTADINPYAPGFAPAWVGVSVYNGTTEELYTYVFFNGAEFGGDYSADVHVGNANGVSQVGYFGFLLSDLGGITDASVGGPLFGVMLTDAAGFVGYNNDGITFEPTFTNAAYAPGREVVKVLVTPTTKYVISVLDGTDIQIHTMSNLNDGPASTVTIVSGNVSQVAAEWHSVGSSPAAIKIVYLDGNGNRIMTGIYSILDGTFHNHVRVDSTAFAVQTYFNMSAFDGKLDGMAGRYGTAYLGDQTDGTGTLFYHELDPGVYPSWTSGATAPEPVFSYEAMTEAGYEEVATDIPVAVAIAVGARRDTRMLLVVVRRWENDGTDWEPLLYLCAYERSDEGWVKSATDLQLTFAGQSNIKNTAAIGNYLDARIVIDKTQTPADSNFAFTVVHERRIGNTRDLIGVPVVVEGCNHYGVLE